MLILKAEKTYPKLTLTIWGKFLLIYPDKILNLEGYIF